MQKKLMLTLVLVSMLALSLSAAAPAAAPVISLVTYGFYQEKGITFKFSATSSVKDTRGDLFVDGESFKLRCNYQSVQKLYFCFAPAGTASKKGGLYGTVTFAGYSFGVIVPTKSTIILLNKKK